MNSKRVLLHNFLLTVFSVFFFSFASQSLATVVVTCDAFDADTGDLISGWFWQVDVASDDTFSLVDASWTDPQNRWSMNDLDVSGDIDPFTSLVYGVTNNMVTPINFVMSVTVPITPIPTATLHGGSAGISVTDANADGSADLYTIPGTPYYSGQIDGSTVLDLFSDPYLLTASGPGNSNSDNTSAGLPYTIPSGPATSTIGIVVEFTLSPGDIASGTNFFRVEPVPEPTSLALGSLALVGLGALRRRR